MAPSSRTTRRVPSATTPKSAGDEKQDVAGLKFARGGFGRVTKAKKDGLRVKFSEAEKGAFEKWDGDVAQKKVGVVGVVSTKRKRGDASDCDSESDNGKSVKIQCDANKKRRIQCRKQLLSQPASRDGTVCEDSSAGKSASVSELPQSLLDLLSMHAAFLKALSLHFAHNGASSLVELSSLLDSMTRLWKKACLSRDAVQRMLGLYEIATKPVDLDRKQVEQKQSPFKIITSGLGSNVRTNIEFVGQTSFNENTLQECYKVMVRNLFEHEPRIVSTTSLPLLTINLGTQTSLHRAKAASTRAEVLDLSTSAQSRSTPDFSKLSINDSVDHTPVAVKSRTLSLFDRVRAKALASANSAAPTAEQITRRHAMGRIGEVVEFLRMKQQQKQSTQFQSSVHGSPGKVRGSTKTSFSLGAILRDIRQSLAVPMTDEESKMCLKMLSHEIPGDWCRMIEFGSVTSITLQGPGMSGIEIKRLLDRST